MTTSHEYTACSPGTVYLVGAGPGDPGLITVKGLAAIRAADVIAYDNLVNPSLLHEAKPGAQKIYVGKTAGHHTLRQEQINKLLVEHAQSGKVVVRLKGGDPFVFGRGAEEATVLVEHGIPWEVIPGITSAIAVPAYAGIPVTYRDCAAALTIVAGHEDPVKTGASVDWEALAHINGTLVFLMGLGKLAFITQQLMRYGCEASTPAAVIRWGSMPEQRSIIGTLQTITEQVQQAQLQPPAVIVIGKVIDISHQLQWFTPPTIVAKE